MTCHNCKTACGRYGRDRYGHQRYRCNQCRKTFQDARDKPLDGMYLSLDKAEKVLSLMVEGCSIRSIERLTDINRDTIMRLLEVAGAKCERLLSDRIRGLDVADVECDEIWGFVWCKEKRKPTDSPFIGDAWCYVAMERTNKLILAWHLGRRNAEHTLEFTEKLRVATTGRFQITTDGWGPYPDAIQYSLGTRVDFAKLIKVYRSGTQGEGRYSPAEIVSTEVVPVMGGPNRKRICTSHIERQNLSIRMGMRRMTRLTNGFSKKWQNLRAAYACWFAFFNFCRVHKTLRVTPAMEAGIADHVWSVRELLVSDCYCWHWGLIYDCSGCLSPLLAERSYRPWLNRNRAYCASRVLFLLLLRLGSGRLSLPWEWIWGNGRGRRCNFVFAFILIRYRAISG